jgi:MoxR-like ATPase
VRDQTSLITDWEDQAQVWSLVETVLRSGKGPIHLSGPPAISKSFTSQHCGVNDGAVYPIYVTEDMSAARFVGYERFGEHGESIFTPGPMLRAWGMGGKPGRLLIEEVDQASGDVLTMCLCALDDVAHASFVLPTGEVVRPDPKHYQVVCTSNEPRHALPAALADRCAISFELERPHPDAIASLPSDIRDAADASLGISDPKRHVSMRQWFAYARLAETIGRGPAASAVFGRSAEDIMAAYALSKATCPER